MFGGERKSIAFDDKMKKKKKGIYRESYLDNNDLDKKGNPKTVTIDHAKNYQDLINAAQKKRDAVLRWLDGVADYGMILDIPTWVIKDPVASKKIGMVEVDDPVEATKYNNEYFIKNRKGKNEGGAKFFKCGATAMKAGLCGDDAPLMRLLLPEANEMDLVAKDFVLPNEALEVVQRCGVMHERLTFFIPTDRVATG
jgi:hypothetical protein